MVNSTRRGRLKINRELVDRSPEVVQNIYAQVIPVRVELLYENDEFDVWAISGHFDELSPGTIVPYYDAINDRGVIRFERKSR